MSAVLLATRHSVWRSAAHRVRLVLRVTDADARAMAGKVAPGREGAPHLYPTASLRAGPPE